SPSCKCRGAPALPSGFANCPSKSTARRSDVLAANVGGADFETVGRISNPPRDRQRGGRDVRPKKTPCRRGRLQPGETHHEFHRRPGCLPVVSFRAALSEAEGGHPQASGGDARPVPRRALETRAAAP